MKCRFEIQFLRKLSSSISLSLLEKNCNKSFVNVPAWSNLLTNSKIWSHYFFPLFNCLALVASQCMCNRYHLRIDFWYSKFFISKISRILPKKISLKNIKLGAQLLLMILLYNNCWSTLFTKIGPKFQTLISNGLTF